MSNGHSHNGSEPKGGTPPALVVRGLTKQYGDNIVVKNLDLDLPSSSLVGLLGPNGAGKTTLLKLLVGLIAPDRGSIQIGGFDLAHQETQARGQLAYVPDVPSLYPELTVYEHLELIARAHKSLTSFDEDARSLLERFGLWAVRNSPTFALSRGMTQKLAICGAFVRPSSVLLMDEPGGSLDIASVEELYRLLEEYREYGGMGLLSSHQWETLQDVCDYFVLLGPSGTTSGDLPLLRLNAGLEPDASLRRVYLNYMTSNPAYHQALRGGYGDDEDLPDDEPARTGKLP